MTIELNIEPRRVYDWETFRREKPAYSMALDGFVNAPTIRDPDGPYANFDHHSVDRISTRSTSDQVHMEINSDLFETFRKNGIPEAKVWINDPDEDTCLAWWLLKNFERVINHAEPRINRLVYCEDRLDSTAGSYPFGDISMRRKMAWIFQPYNDIRFSGELSQMNSAGMRNVVESVESRIDKYVFGDCGEIALEGHYEKIGGGTGWVLTKETGPASRMAMYNDGIKAFAALVAKKSDGSFVYTLGRKGVWTLFNLPKIYRVLNNAENGIVSKDNLWGGSNTVGGSPRETGSRLNPEQLQKIINSAL
ncbi:hypothetical protein J4474_00485 [Candidatus Pacearchaeota archaeon]|nr:hypothetical protein [Candidatus Pacearchaeota archaeon]